MIDEVKKAREFWATQDSNKSDGIYIMSECSDYIKDHAIVETEFKVIEYFAYTDLLREAMKLREALEAETWYNDRLRPNEALANFDKFLKYREGK